MKNAAKKPIKIALISSAQHVQWVSCQSIGSNLKAAYGQLPDTQVRDFQVFAEFHAHDYQRLVETLYHFHPEQISIIDHAPHPEHFIRAFVKHWPSERRPVLNIHAYGDFVFYGGRWLEIERLLRGLRVRWICASQRHSQLMSRFLRAGRQSTCVCPFPVDTDLFCHDFSGRAESRVQMGVAGNETVFIYSGRLSLQKNIEMLLIGFFDFLRVSKKRAKLWVVGRTDELGAMYFGVHQKLGDYDQRILNLLEQNADLRPQVVLMDRCVHSELTKLYNAADVFVSLSTHHDEDYGMAPVESLCTGTRAVLTRWGGFDGFDLQAKGVEFIAVDIDHTSVFVNSKQVFNSFAEVTETPDSSAERRQRSNLYRRRFAIKHIAELDLPAALCGPVFEFRGFSDLMKATIPSDTLEWYARPALFNRANRGSHYHSLYGTYFEDQ